MKNNKFVRVIKTSKYKDVNLYLRFSFENKDNALVKACLLSKLIGEITNKYPTKHEMVAGKDMLYGFSCDCNFKNNANLVSLYIHYSFINPKFVDVSIDEYNTFIKETLFNSIIDEKTLKEAVTTFSAALRRKNDKPSAMSTERFIEIVSKDNKDFNNLSRGEKFINSLAKISVDDLKQMYRYIINKAQLHVYLCGDLSDSDVAKLTTYRFDNRDSFSIESHRHQYKKKKTIIDKKDISQTYLSVVYSTPFSKKHKEYYAWLMGNYLLGVGPTSLLFSEIREKMSLCYTIDAVAYRTSGIVRISTCIDGKNKDVAIKEIINQVNRLACLDYDHNILDITKRYVINNLMGVYDDLDSLVDYYYTNDLFNEDISVEEYCAKINEITVKDIAKVYKKYVPYFNYILLGTKHE